MSEKRSQQEYYKAVNKVLLEDWDPIGVRGILEAKDECDTYAIKLSEMLCARKSKKEIFDYLRWVETERMGLQGDRDLTEKIADTLVQISKARSA